MELTFLVFAGEFDLRLDLLGVHDSARHERLQQLAVRRRHIAHLKTNLALVTSSPHFVSRLEVQ